MVSPIILAQRDAVRTPEQCFNAALLKLSRSIDKATACCQSSAMPEAQDLQALRSMISESLTILSTAGLTQQRLKRAAEPLGASVELTDELLRIPPAAAREAKGGRKTAERGRSTSGRLQRCKKAGRGTVTHAILTAESSGRRQKAGGPRLRQLLELPKKLSAGHERWPFQISPNEILASVL